MVVVLRAFLIFFFCVVALGESSSRLLEDDKLNAFAIDMLKEQPVLAEKLDNSIRQLGKASKRFLRFVCFPMHQTHAHCT